jgi:flagellar biosynthetic protein FliP
MGEGKGRLGVIVLAGGLLFASAGTLLAQDGSKDDPNKTMSAVEMVLGLSLMALAPMLILMVTCFARIVIVLCFLRRAIGAVEIPPTTVVTGLAIALSLSVMAPTIGAIKKDAVDPYTAPQMNISRADALGRAEVHIRKFMFQYARVADIRLFLDQRGIQKNELTQADVPTDVLVPAFVISELRRAFIMGFAIFLPFLIIDLVVASTLMSMGMVVLTPTLVSLPFKILLFILVDGWHLVVGSLLQSYSDGSTAWLGCVVGLG